MIEGIRCAQLVKWATVIHRAGHRRAAFLMSPLAILIPLLLFLPSLSGAGVAQLVEHLICNQRVGGSIPSASSTRKFCGGARAERILTGKTNGLVSFDTSPFCVFVRDACKLLKAKFGTRRSFPKKFSRDAVFASRTNLRDGWVSG